MQKRLITLIVLFLFGCHAAYQPSSKMSIVNEIRKNAALKIKNELGLIPCGTTGQMLNQIQMIGLLFDYHQPLTVEEGRELVIKAAEKLLQEINMNEQIHPYLVHFPFSSKNVVIKIYVQQPNGSGFGPDHVCVFSLRNAVIDYKIELSEPPFIQTIHSETYEEALQLLNQADQSKKVAAV